MPPQRFFSTTLLTWDFRGLSPARRHRSLMAGQSKRRMTRLFGLVELQLIAEANPPEMIMFSLFFVVFHFIEFYRI